MGTLSTARDGVHAQGGEVAPEPRTALGLVASGLGSACVRKSMLHGHLPGVTVRELPWFQRSVPLRTVWHRTDLRPVVAAFRTTVLAAGAEDAGPRG